MSELVLVGVSHRTAGVELRERLALSTAQAGPLLAELIALPSIDEALALSTCGRTELYALAPDYEAAEADLLRALARHGGVKQTRLAPQTQIARGREALEHLFRVAAGLESMVLGEVEILGQLRTARDTALAAGAGARTMVRLVDRALGAGRMARERTGIAAGRVSIASVAVGLARTLLADGGGHALVIGTGDTGAQTATALARAGIDVSIAAGRLPERAHRLAADVGGTAVAIQGSLLEPLAAADVVVSCTASPHALVPLELLENVVERRGGRPLLVFDLAMPRDVDAAARTLDGVQLYDLDDLGLAARTATNARAAAVPAARAIVAAEVDRCASWLDGLNVVPTIKRLRLTVEDTVLEALRRSELGAGADEPQLRAASQAIVTRLLHHPTLRLRNAAALGDGQRLAAAVGELFAFEADRAA